MNGKIFHQLPVIAFVEGSRLLRKFTTQVFEQVDFVIVQPPAHLLSIFDIILHITY